MRFEEKHAKPDCTLGHACQFCPQEPTCKLDKPYHNKTLIEARLEDIDQIIVVLANKGGVGKSTVSANLAAGLAMRGYCVGIADADIHGPNQSRFFGHAGARTRTTKHGLTAQTFASTGMAHPVRIGSLAFLLEHDSTPVVWRDAYKHDFIHHLIGSFDWGPLDYLIIDMPPGTGNELITLCDMLEGSNVSALLVSTPQAVAQMDSLKAARFCQERGLPVIGAVENMAGVVCPHCDGEFHVFPDAGLGAALAAMGIAKLGSLPLSPDLAMASDTGAPPVSDKPDGIVARAFAPVIDAVVEVGRGNFNGAVARTLEDVFAQNLSDAGLQAAMSALPDADKAEMEATLTSLLGGESTRLRSAADRGRGS